MKELERITEYQIIYKDGTESITECEEEATKEFEEHNKKDVDQFFSKEWIVFEDEFGTQEFEEGWVDLIYPKFYFHY